jgi:hypothetical protein
LKPAPDVRGGALAHRSIDTPTHSLEALAQGLL